MNSLELKEKTIYSHLQPFLSEQGYKAISTGKEFRKTTSSGFKSLLFSFSKREGQQMLQIHLGVHFHMIESLVSQFLMEEELLPESQHTIFVSPHRFNHPPLRTLSLTDDTSLQIACSQIKEFMDTKGFRFLNTFEKLKRVDATINRKPQESSLYMPNQVHRCFKGVVLARLLQRTDFNTLCTVYRNYLQNCQVTDKVKESYGRLVTYLKCFSFN